MTDTIKVAVHVGASADLGAINATIKRFEQNEGPLVAMGVAGADTILTFDCLQDEPKKFAVVAKRAGASADVPAGAALAASGTIYVGGSKAMCDAVRGP